MNIICVTGTDTGVGKTWVTAALGAALVARGKSVVAIKPVESGVQTLEMEDGVLLAQATGQAEPTQALTRLMAPVAPPLAADLEGVRLDAAAWTEAIMHHARRADVTLVEGAGGLLSPMTWTKSLRDLAASWRARALVVALNKLGTLNHTLMTIELLERAGVMPVGVVLNTVSADDSTSTNVAALKRVRPFLGVTSVPRVRTWHRAVSSVETVADWVTR